MTRLVFVGNSWDGTIDVLRRARWTASPGSTRSPAARIPSGSSPHANSPSDEGRETLHASIGMVYSPLDRPQADATRMERGLEDLSHAVRPGLDSLG